MFRSMMSKWWWALGLAALLAGCGGGDDPTKARVRFVNASSGYTSLDLYIDDERRFGAVGYAGNDTYVEVDPDQTDSELRRVGSSTALVSTTPSLQKDRNYTLLAYGGDGALKTLLIDESGSKPDSGKSRLRVLNAAPDAGTLDIYVTGSDELLSDSVPLQSTAAVGTLNGYLTFSSGNRRLRITAAGNKTDLRVDLPSVSFGSEQIRTLVITPGSGGMLVNVLLLTEGGGISRLDAPQARVRAVGGVSSGGTVVASIGGVSLLNGVGAPVISNYALVTAGSATPVVSVNGVAVTTAATTLNAGADYTLLIWGPASAPQVAWISDDNRLPSDTSKAKVRLVHGVADQSALLALKVDTVPLVDSVAQATASSYVLQAASTTADITVTAVGVATPLVDQTDRVFAASGNYTVFVLGATGAVTGQLTKDR